MNPLGPVAKPIVELLKAALRRVRIRTIDGEPCYCLLPRHTVLALDYQHDHRCRQARDLLK